MRKKWSFRSRGPRWESWVLGYEVTILYYTHAVETTCDICGEFKHVFELKFISEDKVFHLYLCRECIEWLKERLKELEEVIEGAFKEAEEEEREVKEK